MKDRWVRGSIAGIIAGIVMNVVSYISVRILNFGEDLLSDYAGEMLFGQAPEALFEASIALFAHIIWTGFIGILFSYLLLIIGSKYILYKGWLFSLILWFILYSVGILFEVPLLKMNSAATITSNIITATVYGILLGAFIQNFNKKIQT